MRSHSQWKLVLGCTELPMPVFNTTLMGLPGLSAGTYLGMRIPEPTKPTP